MYIETGDHLAMIRLCMQAYLAKQPSKEFMQWLSHWRISVQHVPIKCKISGPFLTKTTQYVCTVSVSRVLIRIHIAGSSSIQTYSISLKIIGV